MSALHELLALTRSAGRDAVREFFAPLTWLEIKRSLGKRPVEIRKALLHSDTPISSHGEDLLNRVGFATRVAEGLKTTPTANGFVVSLEGPWGFGKTSVLNLIEDVIEGWPVATRPVIVRFNPWLVGSAEGFVQSFFIQLAIAIEQSEAEAGGRAAKELLGYSAVFTVLKFMTRSDPWIRIAKEAMFLAAPSSERASGISELDLETRRLAVMDALTGMQRQILVFIDDLDRLPPTDVFQMLRLVKSIGDFPGITYVLCYDFNYVADALRSNGVSDAETYLDKIVQTRLSLPAIDREDLLNIFNAEYDSLDGDARKDWFPKQQERLTEVYYFALRQLFENPRDIKRLFNRLRFTEPGCRGEVNVADLMGLEALALKAPKVYEHLKQNPEAYVGRPLDITVQFKEPKDVIEAHAEQRKEVLNSVPRRYRANVARLIELLFPQTKERDFSNWGQAGQGLVAAADRLAIALSAGLPSREVPYSLAQEFLANPARRAAIVEDVLQRKNLHRFAEHLMEAQKRRAVKDVWSYVLTLGRAVDTPAGVETERQVRDFFDPTLSRRVWWLIEQASEKEGSQAKVGLFRRIVETPELLSIATQAISFLQAQHGAFENEAAKSEDRRWVSAADLSELTNIWAKNVLNVVRDGSIRQKAAVGVMLFRLKRFRPEVFAEVIETAVDDVLAFDFIMEMYGHRGSDSTGGDYARFMPGDFARPDLEEKVKELAKKRVDNRALPPQLRNIYRALLTGKKIYLKSGEVDDDAE